MATASATTKYVRVSPRKARLAADIIRGRSVPEARAQLEFMGQKGAKLLLKTLHSALANAELLTEARPEDLFVQEVRIDVGPTFKRAKSRNRGGRSPIIKRTSHFTIKLGSIQE